MSLLGANLPLVATPTITSQPHDEAGRPNTILSVGHDDDCALHLEIAATGVGPLQYQWKKGTANVVHPTANQPVLHIAPATLEHAGSYTCVVTDSEGPVTSQVAKVATVDARPKTVLALEGASFTTFTAAANAIAPDATLAYRWYWQKEGGPRMALPLNNPKYVNVTTKTLKVRNIGLADADGVYFCLILAKFGAGQNYTMDSGFQKLVVVPQPASKLVSVDEAVNLEVLPVNAAGVDLTFQWKKTGVAISGATDSTFSIPNAALTDSAAYTCTVGAPGAIAVTPAAAQVFVLNNDTKQFLSSVGASPILNFSPAPVGAAYSFQWFKGATALANDADFANVTTASMMVKGASVGDATDFHCQVSAFGSTRSTGPRQLILIPAPASTTVSEGATAQLEIIPVGADQPTIDLMSYQWKKGVNNLTSDTADERILVIDNVTDADAGDYTCVVTLPGVGSTISPVGKVVVVDTSVVNVIAVTGASPTLSISSSAAVGQTYQWFKVANPAPIPLADGADYGGATTKILMVKLAAIDDAASYFCRVTTFGEDADSGTRNLVIVPPPPSTTVAVGDPLSLEVFPAGADSIPLTYQWKKGTTEMAGATNKVYDVSAAAELTDSGDYSVIVRLPSGAFVTSGLAKVVVVDPAPATVLALTGASPSLSVTTTGTLQTFQWFKKGEGGDPDEQLPNDARYSGVTSKTLLVKVAALTAAGEYYCVVSTHGDAVSVARRLVLVPPPASKLVKLGDPLNLQVVPAGADPATLASMSYQWRKAATDIAGETNDTYTIAATAMTDSGSYACTVTIPGLPAVTSGFAKVVIVNPASNSRLVAQGVLTTTFTIPISGLGHTIQWFRATTPDPTPLVNDTKYGGVTTAILTVKAAQLVDAGPYYSVISAFGQTIQTELQHLVVISPPSSKFLDLHGDWVLEVTSAGAPVPLNFLWRKNTTDLPAETNPTLEFTNVQFADAAGYTCLVTLPIAPTALTLRTVVANVTIVDAAAGAVIGVAGKTASLSLATAGIGQFYQWTRVGDPTPLANGAKYAGATTKTLVVSNLQPSDAGGYVCTVTAYGRSTPMGVVLRNLEVVTSPVNHQLVALGLPFHVEVTTTGTIAPLNYQWKKITTNISGATSDAFDIGAVALTDAADYVCTVGIPGFGSVSTNPGKLAVANLASKTVNVNRGANALIGVPTAGTLLTYQWYRGSGPGRTLLSNGAEYSNVTTATMTVLAAQADDAGEFVCDIIGPNNTLTTQPITLVVKLPPELGDVAPPTGIVGGVYYYKVPVSPEPYKAPSSYSATPLPPGVKFSTTTGEFTGKPTAAGTTNITVKATNIVGTSEKTVSLTVNPIPAYLPGTYAAPIVRQIGLGTELGGYFQMTVSGTASLTGSLVIGPVTRGVTGSIDVQGTDSGTATATATLSVARTGTTPLIVTFELNGDNLLTNGHIVADGADCVFNGWRNIYAATSSAGAYTGLYNFGMGIADGDPNTDDQTLPQGVGYGAFTVSATGTFSITGKTADNETVTFSSFVGPNGQAFFFKSLYLTAAKGSIIGVFGIDNNGDADPANNMMGGAATWSRPVDAASTLYPNGFGPFGQLIEGGRYVPPVAPKLVLGVENGLANASLAFEEGGVEASDADPDAVVNIKTSNVITVNANPGASKFLTAGSTMAGNGLFSGTFVGKTGATVRPTTTFYGIIYPSPSSPTGQKGAGFFLLHQATATNSQRLSGGVFFEPVGP